MHSLLLLAAAWCSVGDVEIKTYPFGDPDPVPATTERRYPYFRYDGSSHDGVFRRWRCVTLENDRIRVQLLPEVGGKVWSAFDKVARRDFLYHNHVLKFRDIAMRGPWVSGGIEYNFGVLGHAPSSSTPVDWCVRTNGDASVSCILSAPEYITRTLWQVEVRLGVDSDCFETSVSWFNASGLPQPLYHWMNAAYSVRGDPEFVFPGRDVIGHEGEIESRAWPVDAGGRRVDRYSLNAFGGNKSYHVLPGDNGFYAVWWPEAGFGSYHRSLAYEKFGRKIWLWALSREGGIWEDLLTDADGQYTELQSGLCFNQPLLGACRTPFRHPTFAAGDTKFFTEQWGPVRDRAAIDGSLKSKLPVTRPVEPPKDFDWNSAWGHCVRGVQYLRERYDVQGAAELRQALALDANLAPALNALASFEFRRGDYAAVHYLCRRSLALDAYDAEANYLDGFAAFVEGDQATARERFGVAAFDPRWRSAALALVARGYLREGRRADALVAAVKALDVNSANLDALLVKAISSRASSGRPEVPELARFPLWHALRYVREGAAFTHMIRNELPTETLLELGSWYEESGLAEPARELFALAGDSIIAKVRLGDWAAAKHLPVAGVFPFRRETLPALRRAVREDGHWKFRYLLAVLGAFFGYDAEADKLLNSCGNEPDESVFYQYRATRRDGASRLADLRRAQKLGDGWRVGRQLAVHFETAGDFESMLRETTAYIAKYPGVNPLEIAHARALLKLKRPADCMKFLKGVRLLPSEHRDSATEIWQAAQDALGLERTWPENLGQGKPYASPKKVIFDSDMIGDYDDVGAMAVLHKLADAGECEILATVSSTHSNASVGTIELLNHYYGRPSIPVGAVKKDGVGGGSENPARRSHIKYENLLKRYPGWWKYRSSNDSPDATEIYRKVLAAQPDHSVTIVTTGFLTNLRKLLQSKGDRFSPLDGPALVKAKVAAWYVMGGALPRGHEFNLKEDGPSSKYVFDNWPSPVVINDFWFGGYIYAGRKAAALPDNRNPVRDIFATCLKPAEKCPTTAEAIATKRFVNDTKDGHNCFDQSCVLGAVRGPGSFFRLVRGKMTMTDDKGGNVWTEDPNGPHAAMAFVPEWPRERIAAVLDDLMAAPPR